LPEHISKMYTSASGPGQQMVLLKELFVKKGGRWEADVCKPRFCEEARRVNEKSNSHGHKARARLLVESEHKDGASLNSRASDAS
jgi:hypothetical protein